MMRRMSFRCKLRKHTGIHRLCENRYGGVQGFGLGRSAEYAKGIPKLPGKRAKLLAEFSVDWLTSLSREARDRKTM